MTFTYDPSTSRGRVRLLATDTKETNPIFEDAEIDVFLDLNDGEVLLAAAQALDQMAANQAYVLKVISNNGLRTDGAAVARVLSGLATKYRDQYENTIDSDFCGFDIAEYADNAFQIRELVAKEAFRNV